MIISGGENIYPAEVEDVLYQHPAVAECAVIGVPDEHWGEVGRAVVVLATPARGRRPRTCSRFLDGRIARYKIPKSVVFADDLAPHRLRQDAQEGAARYRDPSGEH